MLIKHKGLFEEDEPVESSIDSIQSIGTKLVAKSTINRLCAPELSDSLSVGGEIFRNQTSR